MLLGMGHQTSKSFASLQRRLDSHAQGAPSSTALFQLLELLFTEEEANLVAQLPVRFFAPREAAARWRVTEGQARATLDQLADKGILLDMVRGQTQAFILAPTMAGFFEFSLMRLDGRFDKRVLAELFYQYINQEHEFVDQVFGLSVPIDRVFVQEGALQAEDASTILDHERASQLLRSASAISVGQCYCRHKMGHLGRSCKAPSEVCLTLNGTAESLIRHGVARQITADQALAILDRCVKRGLVQIGDNVQRGVNWICNCCCCCCEAILAYKRLGFRSRIHSNYVVDHHQGECTDCGACVLRCPVDAISAGPGPGHRVSLEQERCFGCGVCVRACQAGCLRLARREQPNFVPQDSFERQVINAIEAGKLQNYIFDNQSLWTHNALRRLVGAVTALPPVRRALASRQLQSRFVQALTHTRFYTLFDALYNEGREVSYRR